MIDKLANDLATVGRANAQLRDELHQMRCDRVRLVAERDEARARSAKLSAELEAAQALADRHEANVERLRNPDPVSRTMVTNVEELLEQGDRAHAALCRSLNMEATLVGDLTAALRRFAFAHSATQET